MFPNFFLPVNVYNNAWTRRTEIYKNIWYKKRYCFKKLDVPEFVSSCVSWKPSFDFSLSVISGLQWFRHKVIVFEKPNRVYFLNSVWVCWWKTLITSFRMHHMWNIFLSKSELFRKYMGNLCLAVTCWQSDCCRALGVYKYKDKYEIVPCVGGE